MPEEYPIGILGCGDYLRWEHEAVKRSVRVRVASLYDPERSRAEHYGEFFDAPAADSEDDIFMDPGIEVVLIFTPPWVRKDLMLRAAEAGKQIITVKPLAPSLEEATEITQAVQGKVSCAVFYRRTGNAQIETLKRIFESGQIGGLALYRQDWLHHYPTWNEWATDPEKNGGPFMDAMVHNLNTARYLADGEARRCAFFGDNLVQDLRCNDTETMKVDFAGGGSALLFITWAADLAVYDEARNDREHIDIFYMVSNEGWRVTAEGGTVRATRGEEARTWPVEGSGKTPYDEFVEAIEAGRPAPWDLVDAWKDIAVLEQATSNLGTAVDLDLTPPV